MHVHLRKCTTWTEIMWCTNTECAKSKTKDSGRSFLQSSSTKSVENVTPFIYKAGIVHIQHSKESHRSATKYIYLGFSWHSIQLHILKICSCKFYFFLINNNSPKDQYERRTLQVWKLPSLAVECNGYLVIWIGYLLIACLLETHAVASIQVVRLHGFVVLRQVSRLLTRTHARTHTHTHAR